MSDRAKPWLETTWRVPGDDAGARLIAAAPALARALCLIEWTCGVVCVCCYSPRVDDHLADCPLDAALTAAGLTAEDREGVRRG